ncbi:hypothetical protein N7490_009695 [Penicillium lividum]|nr:hypothetical protein N7490_009695 [Penicillium lividum]
MRGQNHSYQLSYVQLDEPHATEAADTSDATAEERPLFPARAAPQPQTLKNWSNNWILELLSCVMSLVLLIAVIIVLENYDGKPMPEWPYGITLNALVSLLSTFMKAAMAFAITEGLSQLKWSWFTQRNQLSDIVLLDSASRGPLGAAIVLLRFLPRYLLTFGCVILVVTVATDPFVQQVIAINERTVHTIGQSSVQICDSTLYIDVGTGPSPGEEKVPLVTLGAIYTGLFESQSPNSKSVLIDCSSGNCTFAPYQSLGFCSRCANITHLISSYPAYSLPPPLNTTFVYNYSLPNGLYFSMDSSVTMTILNTSTELDLIQLDAKDLPLVVNFTAMSTTGPNGVPAVPPQITATECMLYFCVNTYEAAVKNGQFTETPILTNSTTQYVLSDSGGLNPTLTPDNCYLNGTRYQSAHQGKANESCTRAVYWLSQLAMYNSLSPLLQGSSSNFGGRPNWETDIMEALYGEAGYYDNMNARFESLAASLTTNARSKVCNATFNGIPWSNQAFVHVRWLWMSLPIALVLLTVAFLIITIFHTRGQYIWKSSPLALLCTDVHVDGRYPFTSDLSLKGMESVSKEMNVCLDTSADRVRLKVNPSS